METIHRFAALTGSNVRKITSRIIGLTDIIKLIISALEGLVLIGIQNKLKSYFSSLEEKMQFSGSVLVADSNEVLLNDGFGMANYELLVKNSRSTVFRIASLTKQFTATAILKLVEQGKISLDDPVSLFIEKYRHGSKINIHQLLSNTSGIPSYTEFSNFQQDMLMNRSVDQILDSVLQKELLFEPGTQYDYSNSGYLLLGKIIEEVSGQSYEEFLTEHIFIPHNMNNTGLDSNKLIIKNRASGYYLSENKLQNCTYFDMSNAHSAGGIYSTAEDLYLWNSALFSCRVMNEGLFRTMITPIKNNYGYGIVRFSKGDIEIVMHDGNIPGYKTWMQRIIPNNITVILLSNIENGESLSEISGEIEKIMGLN